MFKKIYLDMDGVLANFDQGFINRAGVHPVVYENEHGPLRLWEKIYGWPDFFSTLPEMPDMTAIVNLCIAHAEDVMILSSPSQTNRPLCMIQKRMWVDKHISPHFPAIFESKKFKYAGPNRLLVDDYLPKIEGWQAHEGVGILFKNYKQLKEEIEKHV